MSFLPDKDIMVGGGAGLGDVKQSFSQTLKSTWGETMAAMNGLTQQNIADKIVKESVKGNDQDTFALSRAIRGQEVPFWEVQNPTGKFLPIDTREKSERIEEVISKHDAIAAQTGGKTAAQLKDEYFKKLEETKKGDESENTNLAGTVLGVIGGALSDPLTLIGGPALKTPTLIKSTISALFTETLIQGTINATDEEKALNIALAGAGGAALHGLIKGGGKLLEGVGLLSAKPSTAKLIKGISEGKTLEETVAETTTNLVKSSQGAGSDFVANIGKMADEVTDPLLKAEIKHVQGKFAPFKGTTKEVIINGEKATARFNAYEPIGDIKASFKIEPRKGAATTQEILDTLASRNLEPSAENFGALAKELSDPITATGKYAHYVDRLETTRVVDGKKAKRVLPVAPEFESAELAAARISEILSKEPLHRELHVLPKANGKFGIAQESTLTYLPHTRNYKTATEAELDIPRIAKESGIPESEIKAVEGVFLEKRTGTSGTTFKLATGASEADLASIQQGLPYNFNESPIKLKRDLSDGFEDALPHVKAAEKMANQPDLTDGHYEVILKNIMNDPEIPDIIPGVGDKAAFNSYISKAQKLISEFDKCRGN